MERRDIRESMAPDLGASHLNPGYEGV